MNSDGPSQASGFRDALVDCKRFFISAARECLRDQPDADANVRQELIRRMVDLHKGLLIKVYATVARADRSWSPEEQQLAAELVEHVWGTRLDGDSLTQAVRRVFRDAGGLRWYSLVRPFDRIAALRDRVADLETAVLRIANFIVKADGKVTHEEMNALRAIQHELNVHLHRLSLDESQPGEESRASGSQAIEIIHQDSTLLGSRQPPRDGGPRDALPGVPADSLEHALDDLRELIGLRQIKEEVTTLTNYLQLQQHRQAAGLPQHELSLHMVFTGNPGTGKTTVARIVGRIFKALGLLKKGHLVETDRSGLVAEYAGQTGPKTHRRIDEALDGVLFIDEAYSLVSSAQEDAYGLEAVQALVKRMEDDRLRLIVILAGYPDPMQELLQCNPGLKSRFNTQMHFEDYQPADLGRIFERMCQASCYELPGITRAKLLIGFTHLYQQRDDHFGNGRLVRNTFENCVRRLANRVAGVAPVTRELLTVLTPDDVHMDQVPSDLWNLLDDPHTRFGITCTRCRKSARVRADLLGKRVACPRCRETVLADWGEAMLRDRAAGE
ncbi:MAG: AAA family ATPase [Planctomycetes bacterium]|nr:AAA family ATPase [Planctomycetota bacterium]